MSEIIIFVLKIGCLHVFPQNLVAVPLNCMTWFQNFVFSVWPPNHEGLTYIQTTLGLTHEIIHGILYSCWLLERNAPLKKLWIQNKYSVYHLGNR